MKLFSAKFHENSIIKTIPIEIGGEHDVSHSIRYCIFQVVLRGKTKSNDIANTCEFDAVQNLETCANRVDLEKCCKMNIYFQKPADTAENEPSKVTHSRWAEVPHPG